MKQNVKRIWLVLCMALCLSVLSGCSQDAAAGEEEVDTMTALSIQQGTEQYLSFFNEMTGEQLEQAVSAAEKNKDTVMLSALNSWISVKEDLGAFKSNEPAVVTASDDGFTAKMNTVYENRNMEFTLIVDDQLNNILSMSFTPEYTTGEKMKKAALNTLMGMGTVFLVLIFISWLISCFKYINQFEANTKKKAAEKAVAKAPAVSSPAPAPAVSVPAAPVPAEECADESDDTELAAVIAAAIAASEGKVSADGLVVRSIKRVPGGSWKRA